MKRRPTGSKLELAIACPGAFALPWVDEPVGAPALRGTVIHAYLEDVANHGEDVAIGNAPEESRPFLRSIDLERLKHHTTLQPEAAIAYDWRARTARLLGYGLGRAYPSLVDTEIPFTIDLLGVAESAVKVSDYKTGRTRYPSPDKFAQTMLGALGASRLFDRDRAIVELTYIDSAGEVSFDSAEVDGWDLDAFADLVEQTMSAVIEAQASETPDVRPGDHCRELYCPAYRTCPSKSALVRNMPAHLGEVQAPGYLAPERLSRTWRQVKEAQDLLSRIEQEIRDLSFREPIDLGDGTWLGPRERKVEEIDAGVAREVIAGMLGPAHAEKAITLEVTKAAIEREARSWRDANPKDADGKRTTVENKNGTGILDRVLAEIRRRNGSKFKITNNATIYKQKALP